MKTIDFELHLNELRDDLLHFIEGSVRHQHDGGIHFDQPIKLPYHEAAVAHSIVRNAAMGETLIYAADIDRHADVRHLCTDDLVALADAIHAFTLAHA